MRIDITRPTLPAARDAFFAEKTAAEARAGRDFAFTFCASEVPGGVRVIARLMEMPDE